MGDQISLGAFLKNNTIFAIYLIGNLKNKFVFIKYPIYNKHSNFPLSFLVIYFKISMLHEPLAVHSKISLPLINLGQESISLGTIFVGTLVVRTICCEIET